MRARNGSRKRNAGAFRFVNGKTPKLKKAPKLTKDE